MLSTFIPYSSSPGLPSDEAKPSVPNLSYVIYVQPATKQITFNEIKSIFYVACPHMGIFLDHSSLLYIG